MSVSIALFTRDLRVRDNAVLTAAAAAAERVIPLFVLDESIARLGYAVPNRTAFLADCLADLDASLRERGARLVVRRGDTATEVARLAGEHDVDEVHVAADVSAFAARRQEALEARLRDAGRRLVMHERVVTAVAPGEITPDGKDHFAVFGPYHRRWSRQPPGTPLPAPRRLSMPRVAAGELPTPADIAAGEAAPDLPRGGETAARRMLSAWLTRVEDYGDGHDDLAGDRTSRLSAHLHFGTLSATEVCHRVGTGTEPAAAFVRQLAWRDFNAQLLAARPELAWRDYRPRGIPWRNAPDELAAWKEGRTGYPVVDAAMRQLLREGFVHNRARMVAASFLTKTLMIDWRHGARHYLDHLVDGDIANNQLNWQWVAGTGTDTRRNRVLNPQRQAERFDPNGDYVRRYVPEFGTSDYPDPIVDLAEARTRFQATR